MQVRLYEGEAEFPDDFASQRPREREFGAVDTEVFEGTRCGDGEDGVYATRW